MIIIIHNFFIHAITSKCAIFCINSTNISITCFTIMITVYLRA